MLPSGGWPNIKLHICQSTRSARNWKCDTECRAIDARYYHRSPHACADTRARGQAPRSVLKKKARRTGRAYTGRKRIRAMRPRARVVRFRRGFRRLSSSVWTHTACCDARRKASPGNWGAGPGRKPGRRSGHSGLRRSATRRGPGLRPIFSLSCWRSAPLAQNLLPLMTFAFLKFCFLHSIPCDRKRKDDGICSCIVGGYGRLESPRRDVQRQEKARS